MAEIRALDAWELGLWRGHFALEAARRQRTQDQAAPSGSADDLEAALHQHGGRRLG